MSPKIQSLGAAPSVAAWDESVPIDQRSYLPRNLVSGIVPMVNVAGGAAGAQAAICPELVFVGPGLPGRWRSRRNAQRQGQDSRLGDALRREKRQAPAIELEAGDQRRVGQSLLVGLAQPVEECERREPHTLINIRRRQPHNTRLGRHFGSVGGFANDGYGRPGRGVAHGNSGFLRREGR